MIRIVVENALLFLLPSVVYFGYVALTRDRRPAGASALDDAPVLWLLAAGAMLVVATLLAFESNTSGRSGQGYTPPSMKNGRIEPGRVN